MRTIIPCAGFGTRLGMRAEESKEMLFYQGTRLIDRALEGLENPLVISRPKKKDLNQYLDQLSLLEVEGVALAPKVFLREGNVAGEWPESVLASQRFWDTHNLLVLPDTTWDKRSESMSRAQALLSSGSKVVFGTHAIVDPSQWGVISNNVLREKPMMSLATKAWGFIGFEKSVGERLFQAMADRRAFEIPDDVSYIGLSNFRDLTRSWSDNNLQRHND